ncbi:hypothetical protein [Halanaerobium sp. ST460_2HS_T2]|uniref:hypothetical protein n=1 Tax=Halanaerobium sp. ST460_2HS_T2 TaxID=2183914 RepID=UPI000DF27576|nr:hypothetical protein [Halanaerobium sp. ST460_2HS_T2]RCW53392.1 hypothetical protein DFR80_12224 [Halanaerobium sp. ST460_2HS_T2]
MNINKRKKSTLLLVQTIKDDYAYLEWQKNNFNADIIMKPFPKLIRGIRRGWIYLHLPYENVWYNNWKNEISNYDTILIHASSITMHLPEWIKSKNSDIKVILWYWNPVTKRTVPTEKIRKYCEVWSFNYKDCEKYNMNYNSQYYFKSMTLPENKIDYEIFFIGSDKGRAKIIDGLHENIDKNISTNFNVVTNNSNNIKNKNIISDKMSYDEILYNISKSKSILEILQSTQSSPSLRTFEALFFSKKLITNNKNIINYDFYHPNNIFIIGENKLQNLKGFLSLPYKNISQEIIDSYDINLWFKRFFNN